MILAIGYKLEPIEFFSLNFRKKKMFVWLWIYKFKDIGKLNKDGKKVGETLFLESFGVIHDVTIF